MTEPMDEAALRNWLVDYLVTNVGCNPEEVDVEASMNDLGVGSRDADNLAVVAVRCVDRMATAGVPVDLGTLQLRRGGIAFGRVTGPDARPLTNATLRLIDEHDREVAVADCSEREALHRSGRDGRGLGPVLRRSVLGHATRRVAQRERSVKAQRVDQNGSPTLKWTTHFSSKGCGSGFLA